MKNKNKKYLEDYKADMITAYFYQYTKNLPSAVLIKIDQIYQEETGDDLNTNYSCGHCVLYLLGKVGRLYFTQYPDELPEDLKDRFIPIKEK